MIRNLQSYPTTVLNEWMWHFRGSKHTLIPPTYFQVVRTPNHHDLCPCSVVTLTTTTTTTTTAPSMPLHCWLGDRKGIRLLTVSSTCMLQSPLSKGSFFFGTLSRDTARHGVISGNIGRLNKKTKVLVASVSIVGWNREKLDAEKVHTLLENLPSFPSQSPFSLQINVLFRLLGLIPARTRVMRALRPHAAWNRVETGSHVSEYDRIRSDHRPVTRTRATVPIPNTQERSSL